MEYKITPAPDIQKVRDVLRNANSTPSGTKGVFSNIVLQEFKDIKGGIIIRSKKDITSPVEKVLKRNFKKVERLNVTTIGPSVGKLLKQKALWAIILSIIGILIYVAFRFKHFDFALSGVIALLHDVLISIAFLAFFHYEITLLTITAILTIAGYSINDTIVVYDRIRELLSRSHKMPLKDVINAAINQTLSRTIITSFTTIMVVVAIFILGGRALHGFSFVLLVGFISGTYSSIYIAAPLVLLLRKKRA